MSGDLVAIAAMPCRPGINPFMAADAELVTRFVVEFKMLRGAVMTILALELHTMHPVVEFDIAVVGGELHGVGSSGKNQ